MVDRWGIRSIQIPCDDAWPYKDWERWPSNPNQPEGNPYRLLKERAYGRAKQEEIRIVLTGGFGDHLYSGAEDWFVDLIADGYSLEALHELYIYLRYAGLRWTLGEGFLQHALERPLERIISKRYFHRRQSFPDWLTPFAVRSLSLSDAKIDPSPGHRGNLVGTWAASDSSNEIYNANRFNLELRHPYRDRRLLEFVLSLPAYQLYYRGLYKRILRAAMQKILPEIIRTRLQPTSLISLFSRGVKQEQNIIQTYLEDSSRAWQLFVHEKWLSNQWSVAITPHQDGPHTLIPWLCISYEKWNKSSFLLN
jgi:asparagine synthase (glutamine-hydrolysing)